MIDQNRLFDQQGFVFHESFLNQSQVARIHRRLEDFIDSALPGLPRDQVFYEDLDDPSTLKQIQRLHEHDAFFGQLMREGPFPDLARRLLGTEITCQNMQYFNKPPGIGQPTPAHQDGYYFKLEPCLAITMWLALEPVDEENGCVRYIPGSHLRGMRPHGRTNTLGFSQGITDFPNDRDQKLEIAFPAQPGDLLAHHALAVHRADGNRSATRNRRALGLIYYSVDAQQDLDAWSRYQATLQRDLESQGKI